MKRFTVTALVLLSALGPVLSRPLSPEEISVLRQGVYPAVQEKWRPAVELTQRLGRENNEDAIPLLVELHDEALLNNFVNAFTAPTAPATEELIVRKRRDPVAGRELLRLVKDYRSRALFEALLEDIKEGIAATSTGRPGLYPNGLQALDAIARTELPGIEADLSALLPHLHPIHARAISKLLVKRRYLPAEPALVD